MIFMSKTNFFCNEIKFGPSKANWYYHLSFLVRLSITVLGVEYVLDFVSVAEKMCMKVNNMNK